MQTEVAEVRLDPDRFYSRGEVAQLLDLDPRSVGKLISDGTIPAIKTAQRERILGRALIECAMGSAR